jgi:hypothetical protein
MACQFQVAPWPCPPKDALFNIEQGRYRLVDTDAMTAYGNYYLKPLLSKAASYPRAGGPKSGRSVGRRSDTSASRLGLRYRPASVAPAGAFTRGETDGIIRVRRKRSD